MVFAITNTVIYITLFHTSLPVQVAWLIQVTPNYGTSSSYLSAVTRLSPGNTTISNCHSHEASHSHNMGDCSMSDWITCGCLAWGRTFPCISMYFMQWPRGRHVILLPEVLSYNPNSTNISVLKLIVSWIWTPILRNASNVHRQDCDCCQS